MRELIGVLGSIALLMGTALPAWSEDEDPGSLLERCQAMATEARGVPAAYDRFLIEGEVWDVGAALDAVNAGRALAQYQVLLPPDQNPADVPSVTSVLAPVAPLPEGATGIAEAYIPTPSTILSGYHQVPYVATKTTLGTYELAVLLAGDAEHGVSASVSLNPESALLEEMRIGGDDPDALIVRYAYAGGLIPSVTVTVFSTGDDAVSRWTMVDIWTDALPKQEASVYADPADAPFESPTLSKDPEADIQLSDSLNTLPPISLGSSSCNAQSGVCFNLVLVNVCFNLGLGVSLSSVTTINMAGAAEVAYPVEDTPGMASITFAPTSGSSSINYSFQYSAELCGAFTFPIAGTCNAGVRLASGGFTAAAGQQNFTSFLLAGATPRPVCTGDSIGPRTLGINPGLNLCDIQLSLTGGLSVDPNVNYCVTGTSMAVAPSGAGAASAQVTAEGGAAMISAQAGTNSFNVTWTGMPSLSGSVRLAPSIGISAPILGDLSVPFPSVNLPLPSLNLQSFSLSDSFQVELEDAPTGGIGGCFRGQASKKHLDSADLAAMSPLGLALLVLLAVRRRRT